MTSFSHHNYYLRTVAPHSVRNLSSASERRTQIMNAQVKQRILITYVSMTISYSDNLVNGELVSTDFELIPHAPVRVSEILCVLITQSAYNG